MLLAVQSNTGKLFRINPRTGVTREVDLGGASLTNGDGLLLAGRVLFVVQNRLNQIDVVKLTRSLDRGRVVTDAHRPRLRRPDHHRLPGRPPVRGQRPLRHHRPAARPLRHRQGGLAPSLGNADRPSSRWESGTAQKDSPTVG